jgi:hypothetical protein
VCGGVGAYEIQDFEGSFFFESEFFAFFEALNKFAISSSL